MKHHIKINAPNNENFSQILTEDALHLLEKLHIKFNNRRLNLLQERKNTRNKVSQSKKIDFRTDSESQEIKSGDWSVKDIPTDLLDRRVELTGPPSEKKMLINALNSGAPAYMADLEDSTSPTWQNVMNAQVNFIEAVNKTISFESKKNNKVYKLNEKTSTLIVRPRGWHLDEKHLLYEGEKGSESLSGGIVDFALYLFHNHKKLADNGTGPYYYLPKLEGQKEAALWNDVFTEAEDFLGMKHGSICATVLIETLPATFQLEEILYALKDYCVGLNCGRWDYIFSYIKLLNGVQGHVLPKRSLVTMAIPFMHRYSQMVIRACHRRKASAIGGMSANIPIKNDEERNRSVMENIRIGKEREINDGHDGTWVAHPALVPFVMDIYREKLGDATNQLDKQREDAIFSAHQLTECPSGEIDLAGIRENISVPIIYLAYWISGTGCVAIHDLMEDAATVEISRSQLWQWLKNNSMMADGRPFTKEIYNAILTEEIDKLKKTYAEKYEALRFPEAIKLFDSYVTNEHLVEFITLEAYDLLP